MDFKTGTGIDFGNEKPPVAAEGFSHNFGEAEVNNSDFTQLASDGKQAASNPLNNTFDRVAATTFIHQAPARTLSAIFRAMQGISAITQVIVASGVEEDMDEGMPLFAGTTGGLLGAVQALADYAINDIEHIADWSDRREKEESGTNDD